MRGSLHAGFEGGRGLTQARTPYSFCTFYSVFGAKGGLVPVTAARAAACAADLAGITNVASDKIRDAPGGVDSFYPPGTPSGTERNRFIC
jgi:hypothetical protein